MYGDLKMMKMHIWDREKGSEGSQSIDKVSISSGLVKLLVALSNKFYFSNFEISLFSSLASNIFSTSSSISFLYSG